MEGRHEMSDTPETDAAWEESCCSDLSWYRIAEKMKSYCQEKERERDEAREELKKLEGAYEDATNYYARMIELREERNEWRECAEKLYNSSGWHDEWPIAVQNYKKIKNEK